MSTEKSHTEVLTTQKLTKEYEPGVGAIDIDLQINAGEIVGFLGPNGAGKTTTMRMLMGYTAPDRGTIQLLGQEIATKQDRVQLFTEIGFLPGETSLYEGLTAEELFKLGADLLKKTTTLTKAKQLAEKFDLKTTTKISELSQGNKRKVGLISALMHEPKLVILDEPTSGLDPLVQQYFFEELRNLTAKGSAVFLSSHVLSEVEHICDRIIMIREAKIILKDTTENILEQALKRFRLNNASSELKQELLKLQTVSTSEEQGKQLIIYAHQAKPLLQKMYEHDFYDFYLEKPSLEEMFLSHY